MTIPIDTLVDEHGHLCHFSDWSPETAQALAASLEVQLTNQHFTIIRAMRAFYTEYAYAPNTRPLIKYLQLHVDATLDSATLMQLFNTGRIAREICRLAGLPKPPNCI